MRHIGRVIGSLGFMAGLVFAFLPAPAAEAARFEPGAYATHAANPQNGKELFSAAGCGACHGSSDSSEILSGGLRMETAMGKFFAPNISPAPAGIGEWTNADFLNAVMDGRGRDGRDLYPVMPFNSYAGMKPEDVLDIKAYIETLPPSDIPSKEHDLPVFSFGGLFGTSYDPEAWRQANMSPQFQNLDASAEARGRYLAENVAGCGNCHTPHDDAFNLDKANALKGWTGLTNVTAPDISRERMAKVSAEAFLHDFIAEGKKFSGASLSDPTMRRLSTGLGVLKEADREALFVYLSGKALPAKLDVSKQPTAVCKAKKSTQPVDAADASAKFAPAVDAFMDKYCRNCHAPGQSDAGAYNAGDLQEIAADTTFVTPGDASKSRLLISITSGAMPKGSKKPTAEEIAALESWINSLAATAPATADPADTAANRTLVTYQQLERAAYNDIRTVNESDRGYQRYFSFRSQYNGYFGCEDDDAFRQRMQVYSGGFRKLLNSLSDQPELVLPRDVEGTNGLLVRVDIRDLGWSAADYEHLVKSYVYGVDPDSAANSDLKPLSEEAGTDLPVMRVDWFMANAALPENYNVLAKLPTNIRVLEDRFGIDVADNIRQRRVVRAGFKERASGVSDHNRMIERHAIPTGYYWKSYDFAGNVNRQVLENFPHGPKELAPLDTHLLPFEHDGGEMIFSLPNGLQGYYLSKANGEQIDKGPTEIVTHRKRPQGARNGVTIVNARSCFDCHANGVITNTDQLRNSIEISNAFEIDQKELLLSLYIKQADMDAIYQEDRKRFVSALSRLGVTEQGAVEQSLLGPSGAEVVTWNADKYDEDLDGAALAAEFDMTPATFATAVRRIPGTDAVAAQIATGWLNRITSGDRIRRQEVEQDFATLLPVLMNLQPLQAHEAYVPPPEPDALALTVKTASTSVRVGDRLNFTVATSKACELQVVYVEDTGNVEDIPQAMIGASLLEPGEQRTVPAQDTGNLTFDEPGKRETLVVLCRVGGLGDQRLDKKGAQEIARIYKQQFKRGLKIELQKKISGDPENLSFGFVDFDIVK